MPGGRDLEGGHGLAGAGSRGTSESRRLIIYNLPQLESGYPGSASASSTAWHPRFGGSAGRVTVGGPPKVTVHVDNHAAVTLQTQARSSQFS